MKDKEPEPKGGISTVMNTKTVKFCRGDKVERRRNYRTLTKKCNERKSEFFR